MKLSTLFDKDRNNIIEGEELNGLYIWQDVNMDAEPEESELRSVQEWGITKVWTRHDKFRSLYERDGKKYFSWDWWPSVLEIKTEDRNKQLKGIHLTNHRL